jgi:hypothetical protein
MQILQETAHSTKPFNTSKKDYGDLTVFVHTLYEVLKDMNTNNIVLFKILST